MTKWLKILLKIMVLSMIIMASSSQTNATSFSTGDSTGAEFGKTFAEEPLSDECTAGVADADVTVDGRPLLWKMRDESNEINDIHYFVSGMQHYSGLGSATYSYLGMGPANDSTEGPVRQGLNSQGLAVGFNVIQYDGGSSGWQKLHHQALGFYKTLSQVRTYLNSLTTLSAYNYFIDGSGEAALWENQSGTGQHWEYNTRAPARDNQWIDVDNADGDKNYATGTDVSLSGWVVRANWPGHFSSDGTDNLAETDRYQVGRDVVGSLIYNNGHGTALSAKSLAGSFFRNNTLATSDNVSNMIVQGVLPAEDPRLSTMWVLLGHSETGIFVPVWIHGIESGGANRVPQYLDAGDDGISVYDPARGMYDKSFNQTNLQARTIPFEEHLFDVVNGTLLPEWRSRNWTDAAVITKIGQEMKRVQEQMDADAYGHLNYLNANGATSNYAPMVSIDSVSYNELEATFKITSSDADGDTPTLLFNYGDGQIGSNLTHKYAQTGHYLVSCTATDSHGVSQTDWLFITVTGVNDAPVVTDIPNQTIAEGMTFININVDDYVADPDDNDAQLTWTYSGNSSLSVSIINRVATITIPNADWNGAETITFRATDPGGLWSQDATTLTVTAVNDAPVVSDIPNQTIAEGGAFTTINLDDYVSDVDNPDDQMAWTYFGNSALNVSIVNRVASITITNADWNGAETITFRATDLGGLWGQDPATFTVTAVNDAPVCSAATLVTSVDMSSDAAPNCTDADPGDVLTYSIVNQGANGTASIVAGLLHYIPAAGYIGPDTFTYKANDIHVDSNTATVNVSVTDVALAPPGAFTKSSPTNNAAGISTNPTLSWGSSGNATSYEYCYAATTGCNSWTSVGTDTSVALSGLSTNQIYYWQVRAINGNGNAVADGGTYWSFSTIPLPGTFSKTNPSNGAINQAVTPTLFWGTSSNAISYEYCYATFIGCTSWISVGTNTSVTLSGLSNSTTYYWQVRAVNAGGAISANDGTYWSFTTIMVTPAAFAKASPSNGATNQAISPTLSWGMSSGATSYEYCYATSTGCASWISVGTSTSVTLPALTNNKVYYWQVRAVNAGGSTIADNGTYWSYTTAPLPGTFAKTSPTSSAANQAVSLTLSWGTSSNATSYEYCYATITGCTNWISTGTGKSVTLSALHNSTTYYWQVRAVNPGGTTVANAGTYWSFSTTMAAPAYIAKIGPLNVSTFQSIRPTLSWGASIGATSYEYCYATTTGCTNWTSTGTSTSVTLPALVNDQIYYWQVRARNSAGTTVANNGAYWSFTTAPLPGAFAKTSLADGSTFQSVSPTLSWGASSNASTYEYCFATTTGCTSWISAGTKTSVTLSGLSNLTTYYWQVRAVNPGGIAVADTGIYWSFTTAPLPGNFIRISPTDGVTNQAINITLSWSSSSDATSYEYCYATTTGCTNWTSAGTNTSVTLSALNYSTIYYWQVRAVNPGGTVLADTGTAWTFTTIVAPPAAFTKTSPTNGATGQAISPTLSWAASAWATSYEYCYVTTGDCTNWIPAGANTSVTLSGFSNNQVYYWQVRAINIGGITLADTGTSWSFTTAPIPGAFGKISPPNGTTGQAVSPTLSWSASSDATSYEYCYDTTSGCTTWVSTGANNYVNLYGLSNLTTYYWQVRAVNAGGITVSDAGAYWKFTTAPLPGTFAKFSPTNGAIGQGFSVTLSWGASSNVTYYEYCYSTITGCSTFKSNGTGKSVLISGLHNNQIYYWQVRAVSQGGITVADSGTYWSFTTAVLWYKDFLPLLRR